MACKTSTACQRIKKFFKNVSKNVFKYSNVYSMIFLNDKLMTMDLTHEITKAKQSASVFSIQEQEEDKFIFNYLFILIYFCK